jgi:hypothetical protein
MHTHGELLHLVVVLLFGMSAHECCSRCKRSVECTSWKSHVQCSAVQLAFARLCAAWSMLVARELICTQSYRVRNCIKYSTALLKRTAMMHAHVLKTDLLLVLQLLALTHCSMLLHLLTTLYTFSIHSCTCRRTLAWKCCVRS